MTYSDLIEYARSKNVPTTWLVEGLNISRSMIYKKSNTKIPDGAYESYIHIIDNNKSKEIFVDQFQETTSIMKVEDFLNIEDDSRVLKIEKVPAILAVAKSQNVNRLSVIKSIVRDKDFDLSDMSGNMAFIDYLFKRNNSFVRPNWNKVNVEAEFMFANVFCKLNDKPAFKTTAEYKTDIEKRIQDRISEKNEFTNKLKEMINKNKGKSKEELLKILKTI